MHNNGSAGSRWTFGGNCSTVAIFFIYIVLLFRSSAAMLSSFSCRCTQVVLEFLPGQTIVRWVTAVDALAAAAEAAISERAGLTVGNGGADAVPVGERRLGAIQRQGALLRRRAYRARLRLHTVQDAVQGATSVGDGALKELPSVLVKEVEGGGQALRLVVSRARVVASLLRQSRAGPSATGRRTNCDLKPFSSTAATLSCVDWPQEGWPPMNLTVPAMDRSRKSPNLVV
ncbi:hypothetical protein TYRP_003454 [Tyrophagus putrescentiae]|nr:hypothetical protein TYRP_003454 [Tyrophagus putrescentiae]